MRWVREMHIEVQRAAKALNQRHRAGSGAPAREPCLAGQVRGEAAVDDAEHFSHEFRLVGEEEPHRAGHARHAHWRTDRAERIGPLPPHPDLVDVVHRGDTRLFPRLVEISAEACRLAEVISGQATQPSEGKARETGFQRRVLKAKVVDLVRRGERSVGEICRGSDLTDAAVRN